MKRVARLAESIALRFTRFEPLRAAERANPALAAAFPLLFKLLQKQSTAMRAFPSLEFLPHVKRLGTSTAIQRFLRGNHFGFLKRGRRGRNHAREAYMKSNFDRNKGECLGTSPHSRGIRCTAIEIDWLPDRRSGYGSRFRGDLYK